MTLEPLSDWSPWGVYSNFPRGIPDLSYGSPEGVIIWRFALEFMREMKTSKPTPHSPHQTHYN